MDDEVYQMSSNWSITRPVGRCRFAVAAALDRATYAATAAVLIGVGVGWIGRSVLSRVGEPAAENTVMRRAHTSNSGAHAAQTHPDTAAEALIRGVHQIEREELQRARNEGAVTGALARR